MAEFKFKSEIIEITIGVTRGEKDGSETRKDLTFSCNPKNYVLNKQILSTGKALVDLLDKEYTVETLDTIYMVIEKLFSMMAPGKVQEYLDFLEGDIGNLARLALEMVKAYRSRSTEELTSQIAPRKADGETV